MNGILKLLIDTLIFTREEESVEETSSMYNQQPANHPNHPVDSHKLQPTSKLSLRYLDKKNTQHDASDHHSF